MAFTSVDIIWEKWFEDYNIEFGNFYGGVLMLRYSGLLEIGF